LGTTTYDWDGDGTAEPYSMTVDAQSNVSISEVYERIKYATRRGANDTDLFGAGVNQDGEQFRGAQMQVAYNNESASMTEGDDVFETAGTFTGIILSDNQTDDYLMLTDPFDATTLLTSDELQDESANTVDVNGAPTIITPVKASPFGTSTGTQIFGSRGVLFVNPGSGDAQAYILTDDNGVLRTPPNTVTVEVTGLEIDDVVMMADDDGNAGVIDKDRFGGMTVQATSSTTIVVAGTIDSDVPTAGYVRVVDDSGQEEHRYRYSSRDTTTFTLVELNSTTTSAGTGTVLHDTAGNFIVNGVKPGDYIVNNTDAADVAVVVSVDSAIQLTTTQLTGGGTNDWANGDAYDVGQTIAAYTTSDNVFAPIIDMAAVAGDAGVLSNTLVQSAGFGVVTNVRQGKIIIPFTQNANVGATGLSLAAIRTDDTIAT
ncbi:MAG: hypothetical protein DRJ50_09150, partial [Actinobacteria bacterium]